MEIVCKERALDRGGIVEVTSSVYFAHPIFGIAGVDWNCCSLLVQFGERLDVFSLSSDLAKFHQ